ncbi:hypothetical protein N9B98_03330 [bacterium]|nr:hypothetical protein [bacterium]
MSDLYKLLKSDLHNAAKYEQAAPMANSDRIEELEAKVAKEIEISNQRGNHIEFVLTPQMSDLQFQLKDLQAQLAKAVDAIDGLLAVLPDDEGPEIDYARTTIAELKGEK